MIHEESIGYLATLTVTWPAVYWLETAPRPGIGCQFAKVSQPMGRSQGSVARSASRGAPGAAICLPPLCVCVFERKREVRHDNNMHHALCTHTRKGASFHSRLNYTGLIGFFSSASKTKTLLSWSPPPPASGSSHHIIACCFSFHHLYLSSSKTLLCIDYPPSCCRYCVGICEVA